MKKSYSFIKLSVPALFLIFFLLQNNFSQDLLPGKIINSLKCDNDPSESYAVYLPSNYSAEKKWPVIIAFEPAARALIPLKLFKKTAENYGYIMVCSNNSKNGPWKIVIKSMKAVWKDINLRFSIDSGRVYTTGFSGGSRAASVFSQVTGISPAGIIACGAGIQEKLHPSKIKRSFYYGIIGLEDFNYKEFKKLKPKLKAAGVNYCIDFIDGTHKWPPEEVLKRAIEWMEADVIKRKAKPQNDKLINKILNNSLDYASEMLKNDKFYYGTLYYENILKHFSALSDLKILKEKVKVLKKKSDFVSFQKDEMKRDSSENIMIMNFKRVFFRIEKNDKRRMGKESLFNELKIPYLRKKAGNKRNRFTRAWSKRLLYELSVKGRKYSEKYYKKKDYRRAILFQEIVVEADNSNPVSFYNLAALNSITGKKKKAVWLLRKIVKLKVDYSGYLEKDKDFKDLQSDKSFIKVLNEMKELSRTD